MSGSMNLLNSAGILKRKAEVHDDSSLRKVKSEKLQLKLPFTYQTAPKSKESPAKLSEGEDRATSMHKADEEEVPDFKAILGRIQTQGGLTPYRRRLYTILLSVPRGRYTTYAAMSDYLKSSARAVGNGMRNNPFAPEVPCHRVLAADGSIGGFKGSWGKDGKYADKKIKLLRSEGVRFAGNGKVVGEPFRSFHEFQDCLDSKEELTER